MGITFYLPRDAGMEWTGAMGRGQHVRMRSLLERTLHFIQSMQAGSIKPAKESAHTELFWISWKTGIGNHRFSKTIWINCQAIRMEIQKKDLAKLMDKLKDTDFPLQIAA